MKLIQKILSHGLLIAFIVGAIFAYTQRSIWFPEWFGHRARATQPLSPATSEVSASEGIGPARMQPSAPAVQAAPAATPAKAADADSAGKTFAPEMDVAGTMPSARTDADVASPPTPEATAPPPQAGTTTAPAESVARAEIAPAPLAADNSDQSQARPPPAAAGTDRELEKRLEKARRRYWQRDLSGAAMAYQALGEDYPDNPAVWGEMGNIYFHMRQREPAAEAYSRCVELLFQQGASLHARRLLSVLYRLDAARAHELERHLQQAGG